MEVTSMPEDDDTDSNQASRGVSRPNEVELEAGRLKVRVKSSEPTEEMMEEASEQLAIQMRDWMLADREIVGQSPETFFTLE
jgi:hypothetical protein